MYQLILLESCGQIELQKTENKSLAVISNIFEQWLKQDAFNGEMLILWDNDNLIKHLNICKKSDWRIGETYTNVNDEMFSKDAKKYQKRNYLLNK